MGDRVLTTNHTTSNRYQEPDESMDTRTGPAELDSKGCDSREVSVNGFHPIQTMGNRMGYRNRGVKGSAGYKQGSDRNLDTRKVSGW
jgi:hypothetical protein